MKPSILVVLIVLALFNLYCLPMSNAGEAYIWTDAEGVIHATTTPPPNGVKVNESFNCGSPTEEKSGQIPPGIGVESRQYRLPNVVEGQVRQRQSMSGQLENQKWANAQEAINRQNEIIKDQNEEIRRANYIIKQQNKIIKRLAQQARAAEDRALDAEAELNAAITGCESALDRLEDFYLRSKLP